MADPNQITYNRAPVAEETFVRLREMDLEAGWLGQVFGGKTSAPMNISGLLSILVVGCGVVYTFWKGMTDALDYWRLIIPVLTLILGYLFGKKQ